eukprot:TRINITY_DN16930_c0_g1_i1.p1 TRINITY_DN16930_c0_g1~~TRINITY_DN16930_c0_g1_i1.p1  ORF type:complete len:441 (-),score=102.44 TRINITY_DN16930_c0_g1_i1:28-1350(-)
MDDSDTTVPKQGFLEFDFVEGKSMPVRDIAVSDQQIATVLSALEAQPEGKPRLQFLRILAKERMFTTTQISEIIRCFDQPQKISALATIWGSIWDQENLIRVCKQLLSATGAQKLKDLLGPWYDFNRKNCTGHYSLDLENEFSHALIRKLQQVSSENRMRRVDQGQLDISQKGNHEGWRNETLDGEAITILSTDDWAVPGAGVLEFDFVSFARPPAEAVPTRAPEFDTYYKQVTSIKMGNNFGDANAGAPEMLAMLRWTATEYFFSSKQICTIMNLVAQEHPARCDVLVVLWSRLVDEENAWAVLENLIPEQRAEVYKRIGYLSLFNPLRPDGWYKLDLSVREENVVATILVALAIKEPGQNVRGDQTFNGEIFVPPKAWLAGMPTCLLYTSDAADEEDSVDLGGRRIIKKKKIRDEEGCEGGYEENKRSMRQSYEIKKE